MTETRHANPRVAAIVCTIARPREVTSCVQSLLSNTYVPLQVVVVDQSRNDEITLALESFVKSDGRLKHLQTGIAGKTRAQNLAINSTEADVYVFTDDDCVVPPDWVSHIVETFRRHPDAGILFGEVRRPAGHDWATAFSPSMYIQREEWLRPRFLPRVNYLFGCSMAITRATFERIGLFDEMLGPGGALAEANEEVEFHLRALRAEPPISIYLTPAFHVVHEYGNRELGEATRRLLRTYHLGKSAMLTKHALRGDMGAACKLGLLAFEPFAAAAVNVIRIGKPRGLGMIVPYMQGVMRGLRLTRGSTDVQLSAPEKRLS